MRRAARPRAALRRGFLSALALAVIFLAIAARGAPAQTFTVTNTSDSGASGDGSLRGEVIAANAHSGADGIVFASGLTGTITFSGAGIVITDPVDIEGPGPTQITIAQTSAHRVVDIEMPGAEPVTIAGLHIANGTAPSGGVDPGIGGNIFNSHSNLTLANDLITGGNAKTDGGIASFEGPLTLRSSTVSGNHAEGDAGLSVGGDPGADWTIQSSTIAGNTASAYNGGLTGQTLGSGSIEDSTIAGNTAKGKGGGSLNTSGGSGRIVIRNSTIAGNTASEEAGGLEVQGAVTIEDSTIAANHADGNGGGIRVVGSPGLTLADTIVAGNTAGVGPDIYDLSTGVSSAFSLVGSTSEAKLIETVAGSDLLGVDPQLGPLQDNGGPTQTMALGPSSPAVNKGGGAVAGDQRGDPRPVLYPGVANSSAPGANGADIGAFELQSPTPPTPPSNRFSFGKVKLNKKKGTATVQVVVPDAGKVVLAGTKTVKKDSKVATAATTLKLTVKAKGKALKSLRKKGRVKVKAKFTFMPNGGAAASKTKSIKLIKVDR